MGRNLKDVAWKVSSISIYLLNNQRLSNYIFHRTDNAIKNRYYSTMRRMQRQSLRKKGPLRDGKSLRVAGVNSSGSFSSSGNHVLARNSSLHSASSGYQKMFHSSVDTERVSHL
jgi:hypothetical protein